MAVTFELHVFKIEWFVAERRSLPGVGLRRPVPRRGSLITGTAEFRDLPELGNGRPIGIAKLGVWYFFNSQCRFDNDITAS